VRDVKNPVTLPNIVVRVEFVRFVMSKVIVAQNVLLPSRYISHLFVKQVDWSIVLYAIRGGIINGPVRVWFRVRFVLVKVI
jgi:hypothetical protein